MEFCLDNWKLITSHPWIWHVVSGYPLEMTGQPRQARPTKPLQFTRDLDRLVTEEVRKLEAKSAIRPVEPTLDQFTSQIFLVPKKDRSQRPVVNLKPLNRWIVKRKFKMEGARAVVLKDGN